MIGKRYIQHFKQKNTMSDVEAIDQLVVKYKELKNEIHKVIVGQEDVVDQVLISIFSRGHCLLVGVPGLAKTLLVNTIAETLGLTFKYRPLPIVCIVLKNDDV